jgi:hypothetical protein
MSKYTTCFGLRGHYQVLITNKNIKQNHVYDKNIIKGDISFFLSMYVWGFRTILNLTRLTRDTSGIVMWYNQVVQNNIMCTAVYFPLEAEENVLYPVSLESLNNILRCFKLSTETILFQNKFHLLCLWILTMFLCVRACKCVLKDNVDADDRCVTAPYYPTQNKTLNFGLCLTAFLSPRMCLAII